VRAIILDARDRKHRRTPGQFMPVSSTIIPPKVLDPLTRGVSRLVDGKNYRKPSKQRYRTSQLNIEDIEDVPLSYVFTTRLTPAEQNEANDVWKSSKENFVT